MSTRVMMMIHHDRDQNTQTRLVEDNQARLAGPNNPVQVVVRGSKRYPRITHFEDHVHLRQK